MRGMKTLTLPSGVMVPADWTDNAVIFNAALNDVYRWLGFDPWGRSRDRRGSAYIDVCKRERGAIFKRAKRGTR